MFNIRRIKGAYKLIYLNRLVEKQKLFGAFTQWHNLVMQLMEHPWLKKAASYLAKNPKISF